MLPGMGANIGLLGAGPGGGDVTPNAVNWADIVEGDGTNANQTITGINVAITLRFSVVQNSGSATFGYSKNGAGFVGIAHNGTLSVSNNDTLRWSVAGAPVDGDITILNDSDGGATLDTFSYVITS